MLDWLSGCVGVVQQWLPPDRQTRNLVVARSSRLDISAVPRGLPESFWSSVYIGITWKSVLIPANTIRLSDRSEELANEGESEVRQTGIHL